MSRAKYKEAAREAYRNQQSQDTEGGCADAGSFVVGFIAGCDHVEKIKDIEIESLKRELKQQRFNNEHNLSIDQKIADKIQKQAEVIERLKDALWFYAATSSWGGDNRLGSDIDESDCDYIEKWHELIGGKRARQALEEARKV